jgi:hypothetical protein
MFTENGIIVDVGIVACYRPVAHKQPLEEYADKRTQSDVVCQFLKKLRVNKLRAEQGAAGQIAQPGIFVPRKHCSHEHGSSQYQV